ncbi:acetyl-CoA C-acyltransferase [bacterium]|nr:acetyl-CoA C-acyltransferase [bacterium]
MKLREPVALVHLRRTPMGKLGGQLAALEPYELLARALAPVALATGVRPDDVLVGNVRNSIGNIARVGALAAGLPETVPATTIDRQCASSLEAVAVAAARLNAGLGEAFLVGGVESASRCPWLFEKTTRPFAYQEPRPYRVRLATDEAGDPPMGEIAELLADEFAITREAMDAFAAESHRRAAAAHGSGALAEEIVTLELPGRKGGTTRVDRDETVRTDTSAEQLAALRPVFRRDGRVTAGNSSPLSDGAAACVVASRAACERHGWTPDAWLTGITTVALAPPRMGMGPALAIPRLLEACGLALDDVDLVEINEAFAAQILAVLSEYPVPSGRLNVHGGAVALGHPFGATGVRLLATLTGAMKRRGARRGVASLCIGGGQGMAVLIERT